MVNDRLVWFLEKEQILSQSQSGFRKRRSTVDQLIKLETLVRESFIQGHHGVAVFFDLEKAYDTTWKYGIMKDLHSEDVCPNSFLVSLMTDISEFELELSYQTNMYRKWASLKGVYFL